MAGNYVDPDPGYVEKVRATATSLPGVVEEEAWAGTRWLVSRKTFAHVLHVVDRDATVLTFRAGGEDLLMLSHVGYPFRRLPWGRNAMAMVLTERTDWREVAEVVRDSWLLLAPQRLRSAL